MIDISVLNKLNAPTRAERLSNLAAILPDTVFPPAVPQYINNHIHTTYSFSPYSPTASVYAARMEGLCTAGIIDHDSISGAEEFLEAAKLLAADGKLGEVLQKNLQGAMPAIALDGHLSLSTAYMNDCEPLLCFAQQVNGFGREGDVFWGISTSGNSQNILYAAVTARAKGMPVIGLTGEKESKLSAFADVCIRVPRTETYQIQELHLPVYHCLCLMLEERFFGEA